ncbi:NAD(P)-binding protein [Sistotremastrum niveocremeum HHB9708]|uniref:NAD(P)-binding protein n=1 Tax=Sistotremastrum niveocremeum HHB9708 TaxID=1314777 RepID=A0A164YAP0_9AGAM|nr:NAD(P)-binding protein [Sistotremastrum niveocremeum HHB9708]
MTSPQNVVIIGGHGHIALRLARLLSPTHSVTSLIRDPSHAADIKETGAHPLLLSLEHNTSHDFTQLFQQKDVDVVVFSAGAGGKGGEERTKRVDYEGAVKIFDAIEAVHGDKKPRLILVSAIDIRHPDLVPPHYNEADKEVSDWLRDKIAAYMQWKYEADKDLVERTAFSWTILRPGTLTHEPGRGTACIGRTHITESISRDDVATVLALLVDRPDAAGLALDLVGGDDAIEQTLDAAIKLGETDWLG